MAVDAQVRPGGASALPVRSPVREFAGRYAANPIAVVALAVLASIAVIAVTASWIAPQNPYDLSAIDIRDGRLPPGSAKLTREAAIGLGIVVPDVRRAELQFEVRARNRSDDAPAQALEVRVAPAADGGLALHLTPAANGPLDPLKSVQLRGLPRGSTVSAGRKDRFRNVWRLDPEELPGLSIALPAAASDRLQFDVLATGGAQRHLMTYWLGTDDQGRDMLSAIFYGLRISLSVAIASVVIALGIGTLAGLCAAYFGGRVDAVLMRIVDVQLSFPTILVALILLAILGKGVFNVMLALVIVQWALYARTARGVALAERQKEYVEAASCLGLGAGRIILAHILPNCTPSLIVIATLEVAHAISLEATLSFLGLGLPVTQPSLGLLIANGFDYLLSGYPWISVFPGVALLITVVAINLVGDELRDLLNPRLQR